LKTSELFNCQKCGECCKGFGGTYVTPEDIEAIAGFIDIPREQFISKYCTLSGTRQVLGQGDGGYCIFWDNLCTIHPVKPRMCRQWPFIKSVLIDLSNWYVMAESCPGMRINVSEQLIREGVAERVSN
jgi:Fe-S-cluster containining protein